MFAAAFFLAVFGLAHAQVFPPTEVTDYADFLAGVGAGRQAVAKLTFGEGGCITEPALEGEGELSVTILNGAHTIEGDADFAEYTYYYLTPEASLGIGSLAIDSEGSVFYYAFYFDVPSLQLKLFSQSTCALGQGAQLFLYDQAPQGELKTFAELKDAFDAGKNIQIHTGMGCTGAYANTAIFGLVQDMRYIVDGGEGYLEGVTKWAEAEVDEQNQLFGTFLSLTMQIKSDDTFTGTVGQFGATGEVLFSDTFTCSMGADGSFYAFALQASEEEIGQATDFDSIQSLFLGGVSSNLVIDSANCEFQGDDILEGAEFVQRRFLKNWNWLEQNSQGVREIQAHDYFFNVEDEALTIQMDININAAGTLNGHLNVINMGTQEIETAVMSCPLGSGAWVTFSQNEPQRPLLTSVDQIIEYTMGGGYVDFIFATGSCSSASGQELSNALYRTSVTEATLGDGELIFTTSRMSLDPINVDGFVFQTVTIVMNTATGDFELDAALFDAGTWEEYINDDISCPFGAVTIFGNPGN